MSVQSPFLETVIDDEWTEAEIDMLLRGVAAEESWETISEDITRELADRSPLACKGAFERIRSKLA